MTQLVFTSKGSAEVLRSQQQINEQAQKMGQIYKDDARAATELERAILKVFKSPQQAAKAFNDALAQAKKNFADGKLSASEYGRQVERLNAAYATTKDSLGEFKSLNETSFGSMAVAKVGGFIGALGGIATVIGLAKSEYAALIALQDKANKVQLDVGQARNVMIRNMLGSSPDDIKGVLNQTTGLAGELKLPESVVASAMAEAMSANSGDAASALNAVKLAGRFLPDQQGEIGEFAGALLDLQKASGSSDPRVNFGLLASISQRSRVASPRAIAMNAPSALIGSAGLAGATGSESAALYSALTSASGDKTGATSGSAQIAFSKSLGVVFPEALRAQGKGDLADQFARMTMGQKIALLQGDATLADQFLHTQGVSLGEGSAVAPLRSLLLDRNSVMSRNYAANLASMPSNAGLGRLADEAIGNFKLNPLEPVAATSRTIQSLHEQTLARMPGTLNEEDRQRIADILLANDGTNLGGNFRMFAGQFKDGKIGTSIEDARNIFASERDFLRSDKFDSAGFIASEGAMGARTPATVQDKANANRLDKVVAALDELLAEQKRNTEAVKNQGTGFPVSSN